MSESPVIEFRNMTKRFGGVVALHNVSLSIQPGEFHAIVGENGAGKSTLMKILAGIHTEFEGKLFVGSKLIRFHGTRDAERAGIGIIHQELNLVEELSTTANIFLGREQRTRWGFLDERFMEAEALELFRQLDCEILPQQLIRDLRVGDQQLVEIAKALSLNAEILIMDEPTSALTESEVERLFRVIKQLLANGVTILYITHKMDEVFRLSDRITVLRDGELVKTLKREETNPREITHLMVGREIEEVELAEDRQAGDVILAVEKLSLPWTGHARQWRLEDINFSLHRGEVLGIAGLMGAGRTELLESLFGVNVDPLEGRIVLEGEEVVFHHPDDAMKKGIALVTEDRKRLGVFSHLDVRDNINICTLADATEMGLLSTRKEQRLAE